MFLDQHVQQTLLFAFELRHHYWKGLDHLGIILFEKPLALSGDAIGGIAHC